MAGLIDSGDQRPATLAAIAKGGTWMEQNLPKLRRADQTTTYNVWGHSYGLRALTRLHRIANSEAEKSKWRMLAQGRIDLLKHYPLYDYHQPCGTGYPLSALAWCREALPKVPK